LFGSDAIEATTSVNTHKLLFSSSSFLAGSSSRLTAVYCMIAVHPWYGELIEAVVGMCVLASLNLVPRSMKNVPKLQEVLVDGT